MKPGRVIEIQPPLEKTTTASPFLLLFFSGVGEEMHQDTCSAFPETCPLTQVLKRCHRYDPIPPRVLMSRMPVELLVVSSCHQIALLVALCLTVDGRNPAPPKNPWNDDSSVNTNKQWLPLLSKWCRISSIHSRKRLLCPGWVEVDK